MLKESTIEKRIVKKLKKFPRTWVLPKEAPSSVSGVPDRIICVNGRFIALEIKRNIKEAMKNKLQEYTLSSIQDAGGFAVFIYPQNEDSVLAQIKEIANEQV